MNDIFQTAVGFLNQNSVVIGTILGVLFAVAKVASNEKAGMVVGAIQKGVDFVAKIASGIGSVCKAISDILANAIKSDGFLGRK